MDDWPPDWRTTKADAAQAIDVRLGEILAELDELEQILEDHPAICSESRQLAGRVRTVRNEYRQTADRLRIAAKEMAAA